MTQLALFDIEDLESGELMSTKTVTPVHPITRLWKRRARALARGDEVTASVLMERIDAALEVQFRKDA